MARVRIGWKWVGLISVFVGCSAPAEEAPKSIYRIQPAVDAPIVGFTLGLSWLAYSESSRLITPSCPCDPGQVNFIDRSAVANSDGFLERMSDVTLGASLVFPVVLSFKDVGFSREFYEDMTVFAETLGVNSAMVTLTKFTVQRPLPKTVAGDPNLVNSPGGYRSFYSGHASTVFSALTTASVTHGLRHPDEWWPWVVTGVTGLSVAYERVAAGRHFPTDVAVGSLVGTAVGYMIPYVHRRKDAREMSLAWMPLEDGAYVLWKQRY